MEQSRDKIVDTKSGDTHKEQTEEKHNFIDWIGDATRKWMKPEQKWTSIQVMCSFFAAFVWHISRRSEEKKQSFKVPSAVNVKRKIDYWYLIMQSIFIEGFHSGYA